MKPRGQGEDRLYSYRNEDIHHCWHVQFRQWVGQERESCSEMLERQAEAEAQPQQFELHPESKREPLKCFPQGKVLIRLRSEKDHFDGNVEKG